MPLDNSQTATVPHGNDSAQAECHGIRWHVFHCVPRRERWADLALRRLGFIDTYFPQQIEIAHGVNGVERRIVPVFQRYTFARFDRDAVEWGRDTVIRRGGCGDVGKFVLDPTARMPANVPDAAIDRLREQCSADGVIYPPEPRQVARNDAVRVVSGPFTEFAGVCSRTSRERVWVLLSIMGGREVELPRGAVELSA